MPQYSTLNMTKATNSKAQKAVKSKSSSSSSSLAGTSWPVLTNGAENSQQFILNHEEQNAFLKHSNEIKQISALITLKTGLGVQVCKIISQKAQEDAYTKNFSKVYEELTTDSIYGGRVNVVPLKFLNIGTSRAKESMSGSVLRKRYSAMKSYINNTLTPLWHQ